jgi:hypothetical protein
MGLTSIFVADKGEEEVAAWARLQDEGALTLRVSLALSPGSSVARATATTSARGSQRSIPTGTIRAA